MNRPRVVLSFALGIVLVAAPAALSQEEVPVSVYVTGRTDVQPLEKKEKKTREKALKKEKKSAEKSRKDLEKRLKKEHGKKQDQWPEAAQDEYARSRETEAAIRYQLEYMDCTQENVDDSVQDLIESFRGDGWAREKKWIRLVDSPGEADLVLEVLARKSKRQFMAVVPTMFYLVVKLTPSPDLDPGRLAGIRPAGRWFRSVEGMHSYRSEEPYWTIEVQIDRGGGIGGWSDVGNQVAATINEFVEKNSDALHAELPGTHQ